MAELAEAMLLEPCPPPGPPEEPEVPLLNPLPCVVPAALKLPTGDLRLSAPDEPEALGRGGEAGCCLPIAPVDDPTPARSWVGTG